MAMVADDYKVDYTTSFSGNWYQSK